ncbi:glycoside hydrolase family 13 protein [Xylariaceae sp. FL1651]|nr:glycoside hydrolase family 13 protein [Xylariaceae sp. FL1651]
MDTKECVDDEPWWRAAIFYQVYPASFKDSNGDGWGDIPGLTSKIDYLHGLGVDAVWLSPVFDSPQKIYPPYACHSRGMKLLLDLVVNHTSSEHKWFKESRSSKANPKRNWYIWRPARHDLQGNRIPPTNWRGHIGGSTWTFDESTQEYYLHLYAPEQPDLNWELAECREAIYDTTMRFWLARGVDGFRIDTANKYSKRIEYVDAPIKDPTSPYQPAAQMWCNGPRIHEFIHEMQMKALKPYQAVSVGELSNISHPSQVLPYVSAASQELSMVFEFSMMRLGIGSGFEGKYTYKPIKLPQLKSITSTWQTFIEDTDSWTTVFCESHDFGRAVSRFGDCSTPDLWRASAKVLALWQATLTGTLFLYQGQEIGMTNMPRTWEMDEYKDIQSRTYYAEVKASGDEKKLADTMNGLRILARDHARLPFQWDDSPNAGFAAKGVKTWMRVHDDYEEINAQSQDIDPDSVLSFYKIMLRLRKQHRDLFVSGLFRLLEAEDEKIFAYVKEGSRKKIPGNEPHNPLETRKNKALVVLNFSSETRPCLDVKRVFSCEDNSNAVKLLISTHSSNATGRNDGLIPITALQPWEGRVYYLE